MCVRACHAVEFCANNTVHNDIPDTATNLTYIQQICKLDDVASLLEVEKHPMMFVDI